MRTQVVVWTALPNGYTTTPGSVNLSVFINPQLITDEGGGNPTLVLFPDWWDWPETMMGSSAGLAQGAPSGVPLSFEVVIQGYPPIAVTPSLAGLVPADWTAIFPTPSVVAVNSYKPESYAGVPMHSFDMNGVESYVSSLYGSLGAANPLAPPLLTTMRGRFQAPNTSRTLVNDLGQILNLTASAVNGLSPTGTAPVLGGSTTISPLFGDYFSCAVGANAIGEARAFHLRPAPPIPPGAKYPAPYQPTVTTLDFHQAISSLGSFSAVLRALGLVFDLVVPLPPGLSSGVHNVSVQPTWTSGFLGGSGEARQQTINLTMQTNCLITASEFQAVPVGPDYGNRMLDLADASRFSVIDLDVDGASEQLFNLSISLQNLVEWVEPQEVDGQTMAVTVPALRSTGPKIVWSGWGESGGGLSNLMTRQATIATDVQNWVNWVLDPVGFPPGLPVLQAEDVIKGHRFDVLPLDDPSPQWLSLQQRIGNYIFGAPSNSNTGVALPPATNGGTPGLDEGVVTPSATSAADTAVTPPPPDLYVSESIVNWTGWSLAAPRYGQQIDPNDQLHDNRNNPAYTEPDAQGNMNPQISASFTAAPGTLPKLRFGNTYRYRARAVDLAGNSVPLSDTDPSTATSPEPYLRYQPVVAPALAQIQPLGPGESTLLIAIVNYQAPPMTIATNGRWLFPPKATEMLIETHGMLDGFVSGSAPFPDDPPNPQTWAMLAGSPSDPGLADAGLGNLGGVQLDTNNDSAPYFPLNTTPLPVAPWLYDPLSKGVSLLGYPGLATSIVNEWSGGPWPVADAQLLLVEPGGALGRAFTPGTASSPATETITLPPAGVLNLGISSALSNVGTLGVFRWMVAAAGGLLEELELLEFAERGQLWMLSPYTVVRLVHTVRLPLVGPSMVDPVVTRAYGSVQASIVDTGFVLDAASTAEIDAEVLWIDRIDDPSDPTNNPAIPADSSQVTIAHAYKAHVPDPLPLNALDQPMQVFPPATEFPILTTPGVIHNIGDTKHHTIDYEHTATSRFAEFFPDSGTITLTGTNPGVLGTLGVDPASLVLMSGNTTLVQSSDGGATGDYIVQDSVTGVISLTAETGQNYSGQQLSATWTLFDQTIGNPFAIQMPSSASPKAPKIVRVSPAWSLQYPTGSVEDSGGVLWARNGGYVRVYLDRPWWSSGNDEMLGVVGLPPSSQDGNRLPSSVSPAYVSLVGLDPISVGSPRVSYPIAPDAFGATAPVPAAPYRPKYSSPPQITLLENPTGPAMQIWPYEVQYDPNSQLWYADVQLTLGTGENAPPPGYFVRLALVRFQPYSIVGAEISTVTLCGFCQPVADRFVSIAADTLDKTNTSLFVTVSGPGYHGWRPPQPYGSTEPQKYDEVQPDVSNEYTPRVYEYPPNNVNTPSSSTMVVEVQVQDLETGLTGDLSWVPAPGYEPIMLNQSITASSNEVTWEYLTKGGGKQAIKVPYPIGGSTPMRLRISEIDYYQYLADGAPKTVDTSFRRPFVALIPII